MRRTYGRISNDRSKPKPIESKTDMNTQNAVLEGILNPNPLIPIRLQDVNRIKSYLTQCGIEPTDYKVAMQHCKEILAQFPAPQGQEIYNQLDKAIGF